MSNTFMKFIDSCVGAIARKVQDEFDESKHPRDKGGRFSSKGGEGRGGGKVEKSSSSKPLDISVSAGGDTEGLKEEAAEYGVKASIGSSSHGETSVKLSGAKEDIRRYLEEKFYGSEEEAREFSPEAYEESEVSEEEDDDEGYMGLSKEELAEEEEYENARERERREKDDDRVTGPEDRDYMNEEDDDTTNSAAKDVKSMRQHLDEELFELATTSESEEEFKSKVKRKFDQYRWLLKNGRQDELPVGGKRAEYALKKIQSEIDSGTSEYW